eukprot:365145-Chlamydomonas_euryale.AAC.19
MRAIRKVWGRGVIRKGTGEGWRTEGQVWGPYRRCEGWVACRRSSMGTIQKVRGMGGMQKVKVWGPRTSGKAAQTRVPEPGSLAIGAPDSASELQGVDPRKVCLC